MIVGRECQIVASMVAVSAAGPDTLFDLQHGNAMKFELISVGKLRNPHYRALTDDYLERLSHYLQVEEKEVDASEARKHDVSKGLVEEAEDLRAAASEGAYEIALDEGGKEVTSRQLAKWIDDWMIGGVRHVSFYIGSADGLDRSVRKARRRV